MAKFNLSATSLLSLLALAALSAVPALADDDSTMTTETVEQSQTMPVESYQAPGTVANEATYNRTETTETKTSNTGGLSNEFIGLKPQFGVIDFLGVDGGPSDSRGIAGIGLDINFARGAGSESGRPYFGISTGALYSHLGFASSDFLGNNNGNVGDAGGTSLLILPGDVKLGYTFGDTVRVSARGGVNVFYNSADDSNLAAAAALRTSGSDWSVRPNVGADLELGLSKSVSVLLRPDWTFIENQTIFTGTLGFGFFLG